MTEKKVFSYFWWDNALDNASETRVEAHFTDQKFEEVAPQIRKAVLENHSDDTPMLINGVAGIGELAFISEFDSSL